MPESSARPITVALVDDNRISRDEHAKQIERQADLTIVSSLPSLDAAALEREQPDVVLVDAKVDGIVSVDEAVAAKRLLPDAGVIVTDLTSKSPEIAGFVEAGVAGFVLKEASVKVLVDTVRAVAEGDHVLPDPMTSSLFQQIAADGGDAAVQRPGDGSPHLTTPRERHILLLLGEGLANKEIAARLNISTHTVKSHVRNLMRKTGLNSRVKLAVRGQSLPAAPSDADDAAPADPKKP